MTGDDNFVIYLETLYSQKLLCFGGWATVPAHQHPALPQPHEPLRYSSAQE